MSRLTLSQARERIAALTGPTSLIDPAAIDWTQPDREAVTLAGLVQSTQNFGERENIVAVCLALLAYQSHLSHEAGKTLSDAAVRRAMNDAILSAPLASSREALRAVEHTIASGLHYAEPKAA